MKPPKFLTKDLYEEDWLGYIVNIDDPLLSGRCKVQVFRLFDDIKPEHLPWAVPMNSTIFAGNGAGSISIPKIGQLVRVRFNNGDIYAPEYSTIQNIDTQLIEKIKDDYEGTHVLLYDPDEELNVIYQRNSGFQIFYRGSFIQISPDQLITISHANQESVIQLDGDKCNIVTKNEINISAGARVEVNADEVALVGNTTTKVGATPYFHGVLGETLMALLTTLSVAIDSKLPLTPGVNAGIVESTKSSMLSTNVLIGK
jgi:hypothetical protein